MSSSTSGSALKRLRKPGEERSTPSSSKKNSAPADEQDFNMQLLQMYYARLFPYSQMFKWFSYGNDPDSDSPFVTKDYFLRREFSFTIGDDIYIRYQSFRDKAEMEAAIQKRQPMKIDIGAIFNYTPRDHHTIKADLFKTIERELVFDIDLSDYDDVRTCCTGAKICRKCWSFMNMAVKVVDTSLREDFGFKFIIWIFSGRRGIHCWVCDEEARMLTNEARGAVVGYLSLESKQQGENISKLNLSWPVHPSLIRAFDLLEPLFREHIINEYGQGVLESENLWEKLLSTCPDEELQGKLLREMPMVATAEERWDAIRKAAKAYSAKAANRRSSYKPLKPYALELWIYELVFTYCYPRLDVNVSKAQNHLLKSPFAVHPKTGRVCVPFEAQDVDTFDPFKVPTLRTLAQQIDKFDREQGAEAAKATPDYKKTDMRHAVELLEKRLLEPLEREQKRKLRALNERAAAITGDF